MLNIRNNQTIKKNRRAYSMMELAIVIGVIGIMVGGLWVTVTQSWESTKRETANEMVALTVTNARSYFAAQPGVPQNAWQTLTSTLILNSVIPAPLMRSATCSGNRCADTPWGSFSNGSIDTSGTFRVCYWDLAAPTTTCPTATGSNYYPFFGIALAGLKRKSCVSLIQSITSPSGPPGLVEVNVNTSTPTNLMRSGRPIQPVTADDALTYCSGPTDGNVTVTFVYRVTDSAP